MLSMLANVNQNLHVCYSVMFTSSSSSYDSGRGHTTWSLSAKKTLARLFLEERVLNLEVLLHIFAKKGKQQEKEVIAPAEKSRCWARRRRALSWREARPRKASAEPAALSRILGPRGHTRSFPARKPFSTSLRVWPFLLQLGLLKKYHRFTS